MPTFTPISEQLEDLDRRTEQAWGRYAKATTGLAGGEYEEVEGDAWSELQDELRDLAGRRADLMSSSSGPDDR